MLKFVSVLYSYYLSPQFQIVISAILSLNCHQVSLTNSDLSSSVYHTDPHCKRAYVRRPQAAKVSPGEIPARRTPHRSAASAFR